MRYGTVYEKNCSWNSTGPEPSKCYIDRRFWRAPEVSPDNTPRPACFPVRLNRIKYCLTAPHSFAWLEMNMPYEMARFYNRNLYRPIITENILDSRVVRGHGARKIKTIFSQTCLAFSDMISCLQIMLTPSTVSARNVWIKPLVFIKLFRNESFFESSQVPSETDISIASRCVSEGLNSFLILVN